MVLSDNQPLLRVHIFFFFFFMKTSLVSKWTTPKVSHAPRMSGKQGHFLLQINSSIWSGGCKLVYKQTNLAHGHTAVWATLRLLDWTSRQLLKEAIHWKPTFSSLTNQKSWQCWSNFFFFFPLFSKNLELSNSLSLDVVRAISIDHPCFPLSAKLAYLILVPDLCLQVTEFATPDTDNWTTWSPAHFICDDKMVQGTPRSQWVKYFNKVPLHTLKTKSVLKKCTHTRVINTIYYVS